MAIKRALEKVSLWFSLRHIYFGASASRAASIAQAPRKTISQERRSSRHSAPGSGKSMLSQYKYSCSHASEITGHYQQHKPSIKQHSNCDDSSPCSSKSKSGGNQRTPYPQTVHKNEIPYMKTKSALNKVVSSHRSLKGSICKRCHFSLGTPDLDGRSYLDVDPYGSNKRSGSDSMTWYIGL